MFLEIHLKKAGQGRSSVTGLKVVVFGTMNGGFWGLFIVRRGIFSRQDQGGDEDGNGTSLKKCLYFRLSQVFHNQLIVKDTLVRHKTALKLH
jgi:hypothetical protein